MPSRKSTSSTTPASAPSVSEAPAKVKRSAPKKPVAPAESSSVPASSSASSSRHPTRESVNQEYDALSAYIEEQIRLMKEKGEKGVKVLGTIAKRVRTYHNHSQRVTRQRGTTRRTNTNSGFLKPVCISKELAQFTGWNQNKLHSRVHVTRFLCKYIEDHKLQNPEERKHRYIRVNNDPALKKLLNYTDKGEMTYFNMQRFMKPHFTKPAPDSTQEVDDHPELPKKEKRSSVPASSEVPASSRPSESSRPAERSSSRPAESASSRPAEAPSAPASAPKKARVARA